MWEPGISVRRRFLRSSRTSSYLSVILAGASERKAQWRDGKEPDLGEDDFEAPADEGARMTREKAVDLMLSRGSAEGLGAGGARGTRCWNSGAKTARRSGLQPAQMEDQRRTAAEKEAVTRRREFLGPWHRFDSVNS